MTTQEVFRELQSALGDRYEASEAASIGRIVLEDAFSYRLQQPDRPISPQEELLFRHILQRLLRGEPVQYILGEADFYGLKFLVDRRVLIPRQETEELVHWVLETWKAEGQPAARKVLDIGTGSGCIPVTLKRQAPDMQVYALDVAADILELVAENAERNDAEVTCIHADILDEGLWNTFESFHYILSNPPYIPPSQRHLMPEHVLSYEPALALFAPENDPLIFYREIGLFAFRKMLPTGYLFFETNEYNAPQVVELMRDIGFQQVELRQDLAGKDRMVRASSPAR